MNLRLLLFGSLLVATPALAQSPAHLITHFAHTTLHVGKASLDAEIASTPAEEEQGLMFRNNLPDNAGMIFLLGPPQRAEFWMKNTLIPLSVAYLDKDGVILEIHDMEPGDPNVPDPQLPRTPSDSDKVCFALEVNLHWFSLNGIKVGDKITPPPATLEKTLAP